MTAVWALTLSDSDKLVLLALADCANDEGLCWPSMKTLTAKCSKTDRTIQAAIKSLVTAGHLTREEVVGKGCRYFVHPRSECAPEAASPPKRTTPTPEAASDKPSRTITTTKRASRLPDDFVVPIDWIAWAIAERGWSEADARSEAASFCDYWQAEAGAKAAKLDWRKTWQRWARTSNRRSSAPRVSIPPPAVSDLAAQSSRYRRAA